VREATDLDLGAGLLQIEAALVRIDDRPVGVELTPARVDDPPVGVELTLG